MFSSWVFERPWLRRGVASLHHQIFTLFWTCSTVTLLRVEKAFACTETRALPHTMRIDMRTTGQNTVAALGRKSFASQLAWQIGSVTSTQCSTQLWPRRVAMAMPCASSVQARYTVVLKCQTWIELASGNDTSECQVKCTPDAHFVLHMI